MSRLGPEVQPAPALRRVLQGQPVQVRLGDPDLQKVLALRRVLQGQPVQMRPRGPEVQKAPAAQGVQHLPDRQQVAR